jgi:hypothetical protein
MALFNFNKRNSNNDSTNGDAGAKQPIVLQFNEDYVTVQADDAAGKTIEGLFAEFGQDLGDVDRASRYVAAGRIVNGSDPATLGTVYRASVTSESKG